MRARRLARAAAATAGLAALGLSCSQILGIPDPVEDLVVFMCTCPDLAFLGEKAVCEAYLRGQLADVTDATRAAWLDHYAGHCHTCADVRGCFYTPPTCVTLSCHQDQECCSAVDGGGCDRDAGLCF